MTSEPTIAIDGFIELAGVKHHIRCIVTPVRPAAVSPAKARMRRYIGGIEQPES